VQVFTDQCKISCVSAYGGVPRVQQQIALEKGVEVLIATPGRLIDFIDTNVTNMKRVTYLVLDEADRMLVSHPSFFNNMFRTWASKDK
jgi:ATP-dependent RNA helicase DDX5/DBP2